MNVASLFLTVPRQEAIPGVDTRPERLRAWVESLPYTSDRETTQRLIERLHDINHQPLPSTRRMALLAPFTRAFGRLHEALRGATAGPEHLDRLQLLDGFTEQLLIGYKYVVNDAQGEPRRWGRPHHLHQAINLAAHLIHLLLACRYQHYLPAEATLWRELGQLFVYAESHEIPATEHPDFPFATHPLSADRALAEAAVLRLADPFRVPAGQVWEVLAYLDRQECPLHCAPLPEGELPDQDHLAVCLHCEPGEFAHPPESGTERRLWRLIDGRALRAKLEQDQQRLQAGASPEHLGLSRRLYASDAAQLLRHLSLQLRHRAERKLPRVQAEGTLELYSGLFEAYRLHAGRAFDPRAYADQDSDEIDLAASLESIEPRQMHAQAPCKGKLLNRSAGGVAVAVPGEVAGRLPVGQLVTLPAPPHARHDWLVAVVRWHQRESGDGADIGLQYIANDARPVAVRPLDTGQEVAFQPALESELAHGIHRYRILVAPRGLFRPERLLELDINGERAQLRCGRLIERGHGQERFTLET